MSEVHEVDFIDQAIDHEIINLELKMVDLQDAIEVTLNNRQNNLSKPWKKAINLELKVLYAELKSSQELLDTFTQ